MALIFERQLHLGAIGLNLAVGDDEVLLHDLGDPEIAKRLRGTLNRHAGGIGTLDELFEAWSWNALGYHAKPFALLNVGGFWDHLVGLSDHVMESGFMSSARRAQLLVSDDIGEVIDKLDAAIGASEARMVW